MKTDLVISCELVMLDKTMVLKDQLIHSPWKYLDNVASSTYQVQSSNSDDCVDPSTHN